MKFNYKELISYAAAFVSFVIPKIEADEIILFGSAARGEAEKDSDIDLFFNFRGNEKETKEIIKEQIAKFYKSSVFESFSLKGIKNPISFEVGDLDKWKLKRSIISEGIVLYGKYKESPKSLKAFALFVLKPINNITKRNRVIRKLFGRKEKNYFTEGKVTKSGGRQLSPASFVVHLEKTHEISAMLNAEKAEHVMIEFWSDQVA